LFEEGTDRAAQNERGDRVRRNLTILLIALAATSALLVAPPAIATEPRALDPQGEGIAIAIPAPDRTEPRAVTQTFGLEGKSRIEVRYEGNGTTATVGGPTEGTNVSVGLGWYIYVYLDRGDWIWLAGLGYTAATAALCAILVATVVGAVACAVAAYIIGSWVIPKTAPPTGYCREFKFTYWGTFAGTKLVRRSC
jgi:hypothetical protein